jgi:hypothetical protein
VPNSDRQRWSVPGPNRTFGEVRFPVAIGGKRTCQHTVGRQSADPSTLSARYANMTQSVSRARTFVPKMSSRFGARDALRTFAILYALQAFIGITTGVAYAVWLLY